MKNLNQRYSRPSCGNLPFPWTLYFSS